MKKVLFDGLATQGTKEHPFSGGAEYAIFILRSALQQGFLPDIVFSKELFTPPLVIDSLKDYPKEKIIWVSSRDEVLNFLYQHEYDVFYSALPMHYCNYHGKPTFIGVVHGLRSVELPWDSYRYKYASNFKQRIIALLINKLPSIQNELKKRHIRQFRQLLDCPKLKLIVVSNHTKYSLLNFYPQLKAENIKVFYSPLSMLQTPTESRNYFLLVNGNRFEKNVCRAIEVFDRLFTDGRLKNKKVIVTGCGKQRFFTKIVNKEKFELLPYVSSEELERLYSEAYCLVYPSLNEGFGYPPLKAMGYATPVLASSATSIPEVCDNAALYFSPTNMDDLANRILQIDDCPDIVNELCANGLQRALMLQEKQNRMMIEYLKMIFE